MGGGGGGVLAGPERVVVKCFKFVTDYYVTQNHRPCVSKHFSVGFKLLVAVAGHEDTQENTLSC